MCSTCYTIYYTTAVYICWCFSFILNNQTSAIYLSVTDASINILEAMPKFTLQWRWFRVINGIAHSLQLISGFYSETSFVVWNGHTKSGSADISTFYQSLPGTSHTLLSYDCQPAPGKKSHDLEQSHMTMLHTLPSYDC